MVTNIPLALGKLDFLNKQISVTKVLGGGRIAGLSSGQKQLRTICTSVKKIGVRLIW